MQSTFTKTEEYYKKKTSTKVVLKSPLSNYDKINYITLIPEAPSPSRIMMSPDSEKFINYILFSLLCIRKVAVVVVFK